MDFKSFIIESENMKDTRSTLSKLPSKHAALIKGYKFTFQPDSGLKNDEKHIGMIDDKKKTVTIAAPYIHSREFVVLHELAHLVWNQLLSKETQNKWHKLSKPYLKKLKDTSEEIFCHFYANYHCANPVEKFDDNKLKNFIANLK